MPAKADRIDRVLVDGKKERIHQNEIAGVAHTLRKCHDAKKHKPASCRPVDLS